ncbi:MAG: hypothetical protein RLZ98_2738 [Pseudomonadota bacterium]|jgi:hypothetical protein
MSLLFVYTFFGSSWVGNNRRKLKTMFGYLGRSAAALFLLLAVTLGQPATAGEAAVREVQRALYSGDYKGGIASVGAMAARDADDVEAVFGLGMLQVFGAVAAMQDSLYQHSAAPVAASGAAHMHWFRAWMPFGFGPGTVWLPANPKATPMTYRRLREILVRFAADLRLADATLARVGERPVKLPLEPFRIAIDLDHDGSIQENERVFAMFIGGGRQAPRREAAEAILAFDTADASWLRGYANLLMASTDLILAFDFEKSYEAAAHNLYGPDATRLGRALKSQAATSRPGEVLQTLMQEIDRDLAALGNPERDASEQMRALREALSSLPNTPEAAAERRALQTELREIGERQRRYNETKRELGQRRRDLEAEMAGRQPGNSWGPLFDLVAYVHTMSWPVVEPARLKAVGQHLLQVVAQNQMTWRLVRAETDDDREWLPGPRQTPPFGSQPVTDEVIDGWLATTALAGQVVKGEKLLPHPRFRLGFNLGKFLATAKEFDLVLMIAGHGLLPYLEQGDVVDAAAWRAVTNPLGRNIWSYAVWFN